MIAEQMQTMDAPITEEQRSKLYRIFVEEPMRSAQLAPTDVPIPPEDMWKQSQKLQDERDHAVLERSRSVLTSEQFERYSDYIAWQTDMRKGVFANMRPGMPGAAVPMIAPGANIVTFSAGSASGSDAGSSASPKQ